MSATNALDVDPMRNSVASLALISGDACTTNPACVHNAVMANNGQTHTGHLGAVEHMPNANAKFVERLWCDEPGRAVCNKAAGNEPNAADHVSEHRASMGLADRMAIYGCDDGRQ